MYCVFLDYKLIEITYIFFLYDNMNLKIWNTRTQTADKILKRFMTSYTYAYFMHKSGFLTKIRLMLLDFSLFEYL